MSVVAALTALNGIVGVATLPAAFGVGGGGTVGAVVCGVTLLLSLLYFVVAVGIHRLTRWGYLGGLAVQVLGAVTSLLTASLLGVLLSVVVAVYLYVRRSLFG